MKYRICNVKKASPRPKIKPFDVVITVENESDLYYLAAAMNLSAQMIREQSDYLRDLSWDKPSEFYQTWNELDEMIAEHLKALDKWHDENARASKISREDV